MLDASRIHMRCSSAPRLHQQQRTSCRRHLFTTSEARVPSAVGRGDAHSAGEGGSAVAGHTWLQRQRVLHHEPHPSDGDIIELNCGGSVMVTSRSTLRQVKGSLLCLLFDPANSHLLRHDAAGRVFLDHDPAAFGLLLRHLRELRAAAGYGSGAVLLPAIPPADAPSFRALNHHLGLGICEDDIAAAVRRGAALAAAAAAADGTPPPLLSDSQERPSSPYASRPVPPGSPQQQQQQQWLRQQWQQQCSPGGRTHQQQQYASAATHPADITEQGACNAAAAAEDILQGSSTHQPGCTQQVSAADWDALTYPQPCTSTPQQQQQQQQQPLLPPLLQQHIITDMLAHQQSQQEAEQLMAQGSAAAAAAAAGGGVHIDAGVAGVNVEPPAAEPYSAPAVQDFYMLTSPATGIWGSSSMPLPLRVSVLTEADMLALQHAQRQRRGPNTRSSSSSSSSSSSRGVSDHAAEGGEAGPFDFDVFCSTSSSRGRMGLSVVVRESAEVDNVFVGLTTPNQADQRGLQIPSFGWHQVSACAADAAHSLDPTEGAAALDNPASNFQQQQQQQRWATGDLVQLALECNAATGSRLTLTVNNLPAEGLQSAAESAGAHSLTSSSSGGGSSSSSSVSLPAFQEWCWYIALYRGTQVVAAVLEAGSYSVYTGDTKLKRYTS